MSAALKYIIVDDDLLSNKICALILKSALGDVDILTFNVPELALKFIQNEYSAAPVPVILFLDINMPTMTGWEFMEHYEKFSASIKEQITIHILSSSIDELDISKAKANRYIQGFISKPLSRDAIRSATEQKNFQEESKARI